MLQFVAALRNWSNYSQNDKMKFTYKIYDLDGSGYVEPDELVICPHYAHRTIIAYAPL